MEYNILQCKDLVKEILTDYPHTRDNDNFLLEQVWIIECKLKGLEINNLIYHVGNNKLHSPKSIFRSRRFIQKNHPETRGKKYLKRIEKLEPEIRNHFKNLNNA